MIGEKEILAAINSISTTLATGTLTTSSTTVPADTGRTEVDHYWDGCILMPISGVDAFQPRIINSFANAGGVFTLDTPLTTAPGLVTYSILPNQIPAVLATLNMAVPAPDSIANVIMRDVVGNKADTSKYSIAATQSLVAMLKGVLASSIVTNGTFTTSSATVPADTGRAEATNFWNGCTLIPLTGADAFQPRVIKSFNNAGGVFTMDIAFTAATGTVAYIILPSQIPADVATILADLAVPGADVVTNTLERDVVGNKTDAAKYAPAATQSIIAMLKGLLGSSLVATGTFTTSSSTVPADTGRAEASSYWKGCILLPLTGSDAFQPRYIIGFNNIGGVFTVDPNNPFTAVTGLVAYAILAAQTDFVPAADSVNNNQPEDVIGNKTDTNSGNSIMASQKVQAADNAANVLSRDVIGNKTDTVSSGSLQGLNRVQTADNAANTNMRDVVGNKADTASTTINGTTSIMRYLKGIMGWFLVPGADSAADTVERDVVGDKTDTASTTINGTTSLMRYLKGLLGLHLVPAADSANNVNMRDVVGNKTDTNAGTSVMASQKVQAADNAANVLVRDVAGNKADAATLDSMANLATATLVAEIKRTLLRMSTDAFTATIQGSARVELDIMLAQLATYFVAAGAAFSQTINPGAAARTAIDACLKDLSDILAGGGITTYPASAVPANGVSVAQVARKIYDLVALIPTTAMRGTDNAALASVLGALADAAHAGAVDNATTAMGYLKQLVTLLLLVPTTPMRGTDNASLATSDTVPAADSAANVLQRDVVGNKTDTNAGTSLLARNLVPAADSANNVNARDVVGNKTDTVASGSLQGLVRVQAADSATNTNERDVIGNKTDALVQAVADGKSLMGYIKGLITSIGNPSAHTLVSLTTKLGNMTRDIDTMLGARWDAAGDLGTDIAALLARQAIATGTFTTSSATVPADTGRGEGVSYWKNCWLMPTAGAVAYQPKLITAFTNGTGVFTIDVQDPFTAATGTVAYVILPPNTFLIPAADAATNTTPGHVIGNKSDAAVTAVGVVASIVAYTKGLLNELAKVPKSDSNVTWNGTALASIATQVANSLAAVAYTRQAGVMQEKATTIDLNQAANTYDLLTGTAQVVKLESLVIRMSGGAIGGALTSISIQTDDATPQVFVTAAQGAVANLTNEAQLFWTGQLCYLKVGKKIRLTIAGGAAGVARVCDVVCECRAVVTGGYLA